MWGVNRVSGLPGIRMETSKTTISSFPVSAAIAPWRAKGPMMPGGCSFFVVATNCSPRVNIFSMMDSLVVAAICPVSMIFGLT